jgi:flagellar basal body rod protein FlgG
MAFGEMFTTLSSYRALDSWTQAMSSSIAGAGKIGYKAAKSTFLGGGITQYQQGSRLPVRIGEQTLNQETTIDWSQGELVDSGTPNHFAIKGEGFFVLMDDEGKFYYTRGGNFTLKDGKLKTPEGLVVLDKSMMQTMTRQAGFTLPSTGNQVAGVAANTYNGTTIVDADLFAATSPWVKPAASNGGGMWLPFVNTALSQKSAYYEDPTPTTPGSGDESYRAQDVAYRTNFYINSSDPASTTTNSTLSVSVDDAAYIWVNGKQLSQADLTAAVIDLNNPWGGYPVVSGGLANTSTFNISAYLQDGVNTIEIIASEWQGGNSLVTNGTINLQSGGTLSLANGNGTTSRWSAKLIGPNLDADFYDYAAPPPYISRKPSAPTQTYEDRAFNAEARDFLLATFDAKDGLRFSKYGNTIYEAGSQAGNVYIREQNQNGTGRVIAGKLEASNVDFDNISSEMKMAEHMYDGLANILEARYSMIDTMFQMLLP